MVTYYDVFTGRLSLFYQRILSLCMALACACVLSSCGHIFLPEKPGKRWLSTLEKDAREAGISQPLLDEVLPQITLKKSIVKLDRHQPHKTLSFAEYQAKVLPEKRIAEGKKMLATHRSLLEAIGQRYHVQPRFIVALWGMESDFGRNMGSFKVIDALATLTYEGRREAFFRSELLKALKVLDQGNTTYTSMKGSWAGAMGQCQFMPSSYLDYAVDYDGDGKRDIWNNHADIFASIAHYLSRRQWNPMSNWGEQVQVPNEINKEIIDKRSRKPLKEWAALGIRKTDGTPLALQPKVTATLIQPDKKKDAFYLAYDNYDVILQWNRSAYFATTVGMFSDTMW